MEKKVIMVGAVEFGEGRHLKVDVATFSSLMKDCDKVVVDWEGESYLLAEINKYDADLRGLTDLPNGSIIGCSARDIDGQLLVGVWFCDFPVTTISGCGYGYRGGILLPECLSPLLKDELRAVVDFDKEDSRISVYFG